MDRYEKGTSLIGEGPAAPAPTFPIIPPSVGYVSFNISSDFMIFFTFWAKMNVLFDQI